jgi:hypothetical protein
MLTSCEQSLLVAIDQNRITEPTKLEVLASIASMHRISAWRAVHGLAVKRLIDIDKECEGGPDSLLRIKMTGKGASVALWLQGIGLI